MPDPTTVLDARLLGEGDWIAATEVCRVCVIDMSVVVELVELGVVVSRGASPEEWLVPAASLPRLRVAGRLMRDLGVNVTGAALAVELLEARGELERRVRRLERLVHE
ncbi:MAG: transcriptional regulator [Gammaproteobacteria bacterium]|jgi:chaperone modulatory protein CbpM|nr:transcriptional regulator [Gammaproteobacteria bacterium]